MPLAGEGMGVELKKRLSNEALCGYSFGSINSILICLSSKMLRCTMLNSLFLMFKAGHADPL